MFCNVANFPMSDYTKTQGGVGMTDFLKPSFVIAFLMLLGYALKDKMAAVAYTHLKLQTKA